MNFDQRWFFLVWENWGTSLIQKKPALVQKNSLPNRTDLEKGSAETDLIERKAALKQRCLEIFTYCIAPIQLCLFTKKFWTELIFCEPQPGYISDGIVGRCSNFLVKLTTFSYGARKTMFVHMGQFNCWNVISR